MAPAIASGPESAGADPGPASYRRGGPHCVTDCNVMLGTLQPEFFPHVFGPGQDEPLDAATVREKFAALAAEIREATGDERTPVEVAAGFLKIAVENMANAIKKISVQRGYDVTGYTLNCFGGAGGQHACLVADALGMTTVLIHPFAGVLSAYGMGLADIRALREKAVEAALDDALMLQLTAALDDLAVQVEAELTEQDIPDERIEVIRRAHIRYEGSDTPHAIEFGIACGDDGPLRGRASPALWLHHAGEAADRRSRRGRRHRPDGGNAGAGPERAGGYPKTCRALLW